MDGREHLDAALAGGRGALLLAGHFTTLEIGAARLGIDAPVDGVYRPHADPSMERASRDGRQRFGGRLLDRADVRGMLRRLRANRAVWYAPDQDLGLRYGVFAPFFGRPAATPDRPPPASPGRAAPRCFRSGWSGRTAAVPTGW